MIAGFFLGVLGGLAATRFFFRRSAAGFGRGRPPALSWLTRRLDLDPDQQDQVEQLLHRVRQSLRALRGGRAEDLSAVVEAFAPGAFDRAKVEAAADRKGAAVSAVKQELIDALARLHEILRPVQRARLQALIGGRLASCGAACQ